MSTTAAAATQEQSSNDFCCLQQKYTHGRNHSDKITSIVNINESEFLTASLDSTINVWDRNLNGVSYTYETHAKDQEAQPMYALTVTGEHHNFLVGGLGRGNFIVYGLDRKNQLDIFELAHNEHITQIVSLNKLQDKYFATRCAEGHVNIWSATNHPDRLFTLWYMDADEEALAPLQPPPAEPEPVVEETKKKKTKINDDGDEVTDSQASDDDPEPEEPEDDDAPKKKVKQEKKRPVPEHTLVGAPVASDKDLMIELKWKEMIQSSSTILCITNYTERLLLICNVDLKTRRRFFVWQKKTNRNPTALFQINEDYICVGTANGNVEIWSIDGQKIVKLQNLHNDSKEGISQIVEIKKPSYRMRMEREGSGNPDVRYVVTSAYDKHEFKIWTLFFNDKFNNRPEFILHSKITTTLDGIGMMLQASDDQLIGVDNMRTLRSFNFSDKAITRRETAFNESLEDFHTRMKAFYADIEDDAFGRLDMKDLGAFMNFFVDEYDKYCQNMGKAAMSAEEKEALTEQIFTEMDVDGSGAIDVHELKLWLTRFYIKLFKQ